MTGEKAGRWPQTSGVTILLLCYMISQTSSQADVCIRVPEKTANCLLSSKYQPVPKNSVIQSCLHELFWDHPSPSNLTADDAAYFRNLSRQYLDNPSSPPSGFRQRKEYRQLGVGEREKIHRAFQILYDEGTIHRYGKLYGQAYSRVRHSPAFLGFQRVFLMAFEEELRRIDKTISLPFWDFTMDTEMDNPVNSVLWAGELFGNGNGKIMTGNFREWVSPKGPVQRRYGESNYGRLINRGIVRDIVSKCRTQDITYPVKFEPEEKFVLEFHYNGVMNWLGGSALDATTAAYDPVFYMLSACTDYIWEVFRVMQQRNCYINPSMDYPNKSLHENQGAMDQMFGFSNFSNAHGYSSHWTTYWYNYSISQGCPDCNSEYLWCDLKNHRCVAHSRRNDYSIGRFSHSDTEDFEPQADYVQHKIETPFMPSPLNDGRTMATAKRDALQAVVNGRSATASRRDLLVLTALGQSSSLLSETLSGSDS